MAVIKKSVRKKLSKYLERIVKKHGAEMTLALVTGIVSSLAADQQDKAKAKADRKAGKAAKPDKRGKAGKGSRPKKLAKPEPAAAAGRKAAKAPAPPPAVVVRKRTER